MKQLKLINPDNISDEEAVKYRVREAARAVVFDDSGLVALLHASKDDYYKLPGGGIEEMEEKTEALKRECQEEIGCDVEVVYEIGSILEYRKNQNLKQISYCYFAKIKGEKGTPNFTESEIKNGFKEVWFSFEDATNALNKALVDNSEGNSFVAERDRTFLKEAEKYFK